MRRRELLKAAAAATLTASVAPRLGHGADRAKTLVFVGVADLSVLDPVITGARPTRNYAYLVFDNGRRGRRWSTAIPSRRTDCTLTPRDGLRFHDKEPVLARDVVASIRRFAPREFAPFPRSAWTGWTYSATRWGARSRLRGASRRAVIPRESAVAWRQRIGCCPALPLRCR